MHAPGTLFVRLGALALSAAAGSTSAFAQDEDKATNVAQACIHASGVHHTKVLDDRNILFFLRHHVTYRNTLLGTCPGLRAENHFVYGQDVANGLCKGNVIRVLSYGFDGATLGASCWLGMFEPLSDDEVEELVATETPRKNGAVSRRAVEVKPVDLPPTPSTAAPVDASVPPSQTPAPAPAGEPGPRE